VIATKMAANLKEIARRQLADYDARRPGTIFSEPGFRLTLAEAYQVQMLVASFRESRGESVCGYKIGCVSEAVQNQLGIGEPVFGHLFEGEAHRSGVSLDVASFDGLAIEGEFAFRLAEDFRDERSIGAAFAVIELHNYVLRSPDGGRGEELIANNAMHAGVVLPADEIRCDEPEALAAGTISVIRNGSALGTANGGALPGGPRAALAWLAVRLKDFGKMLRRGHIVLTGSPLPLYPVAPGDRVEVICGRLPPVTMTLSPGVIRREI
jgi:2-keto-4-pentenoate hydratase